MTKNEIELWKSHPEIVGIEVSTLGRVRTLDRVTSSEERTQFLKGRVLKQYVNAVNGYLQVHVTVNWKQAVKYVHRLVAQTFIKNTDNLPQVNHKDCDRTNNNVENLEFCTASYNSWYREKFGEAFGNPVYAVNLSNFEALCFCSQHEASRKLGVSQASINAVIKGKRNNAGGYWFKEDDGNGIEINKDKLNGIVDGMYFRGSVFAVNLNTLEVSQFKSQSEASRELGVFQTNIIKVIQGKRKQTGGFCFTNEDKNAADVIKHKLNDIKGEANGNKKDSKPVQKDNR